MTPIQLEAINQALLPGASRSMPRKLVCLTPIQNHGIPGTEERRLADKGKHKAHIIVLKALARGIITRLPCEECGVVAAVRTPNNPHPGYPKVVAHHDDYNQPLSIRWLCKKHHTLWHYENLATPMNAELSVLSNEELYRLCINQHKEHQREGQQNA